MKPRKQNIYNQTLEGVFGEFGKGANANIFYVQTALSPSDLDKITLISAIRGSNKWSVRDLFQRDVDNERVKTSIIPYFKNENQLKFFNPLTLTIVPSIISEQSFIDTVPVLKTYVETIDDADYSVQELPGLYRFCSMVDNPQFSFLEWQDSKVKIVAVDGQHRLSALKRLKDEIEMTGEDICGFNSWKIPAVVFSVRTDAEEKSQFRVLDVIRNIFKYINTSAQTPSETRQILLDDESILNICTQEVLEFSHENDVLKIEDREKDRLPLLFFDWRGHQHGGMNVVNNPGSLKNVTEIKDWLHEYILGDDFSKEQMDALGIAPIDDIAPSFAARSLSAEEAESIRKRFRSNVLPGLSYFLQHITPYKAYIEKIRELELDCENPRTSDDIKKSALHKLKFGDDPSNDGSLAKEIEMAKEELVEDIVDICRDVFNKEFYKLDIGLRGIVASYGNLNAFYKRVKNSASYLEYSMWFVDNLNKSIADGWYGVANEDDYHLLKHITYDHNERVVNYRLQDVKKALSKYVSLIVVAYAHKNGSIPEADYNHFFAANLDLLEDHVEKGYEKEGRSILRDEYADKPANELKKAAKEYAQEKVQNWRGCFSDAITKTIG